MAALSSYFLAWHEAERAASDAERAVFNHQRNVALSRLHGTNLSMQLSATDEALAVALRAKATALLRMYLEEVRSRAAQYK